MKKNTIKKNKQRKRKKKTKSKKISKDLKERNNTESMNEVKIKKKG